MFPQKQDSDRNRLILRCTMKRESRKFSTVFKSKVANEALKEHLDPSSRSI